MYLAIICVQPRAANGSPLTKQLFSK